MTLVEYAQHLGGVWDGIAHEEQNLVCGSLCLTGFIVFCAVIGLVVHYLGDQAESGRRFE